MSRWPRLDAPRAGGLAVCLVLLAGCGSSRPAPTAAAPATTAETTPPPDHPHGSPRWEPTANLSGTGGTTSAPFGIVPDVLQWRVHWHCDTGVLRIRTEPAPASGRPLVEGACPGDGDAYATRTGQIRLAVTSPGAWTAVVEQEVDTPLDEAPLPEMQASGARVVGHGPFRDVDRMGRGRVMLYQLANGRTAIRLEDFQIPINTDLFVWTESAVGLKSSPELRDAPHVVVAPLRSTTGNQNYLVPASDPADQIKSIVIWCEVQQFAYVAVDLEPG